MGLGLSASGYENGVDYKNVGSLDRYVMKLRKKKLPIGKKNQIDTVTRKLVVGLRLLEGVSLSSFVNREKELKMLLDGSFLVKKHQKISVNPDKILLLNEILSYFV